MTYLVCNFDKEAESLCGLEKQPGCDAPAEVFSLSAGLHLKGLGSVGSRGGYLALARPLLGLPASLCLCLQLS